MVHVAIHVTNMGTFLVIAKIKIIKVAIKVGSDHKVFMVPIVYNVNNVHKNS